MKKEIEKYPSEELLLQAEAIAKDIHLIEKINETNSYQEVESRIQKKERRSRLYLGLMRVAAILIVPLLISSFVFAFLFFSEKSLDSDLCYAEITAPSCAVVEYELPDHTKVWLNGNSSLRFPTHFSGDKRIVSLKGEANFEVVADPQKPFYVKTPAGLTVYVYGTKFNLSAYEDDNIVNTVLEHGKVNVILPESKNEVKLLPGEALSYDTKKKELMKRQVNTTEYTAWIEGKIIFRNTSLEIVAQRLSRFFNVDIELRNHLNKPYELRATFTRQSIQHILEYMSYSIPLKWKTLEQKQLPDGSYQKKKIILDIF